MGKSGREGSPWWTRHQLLCRGWVRESGVLLQSPSDRNRTMGTPKLVVNAVFGGDMNGLHFVIFLAC